MWASAIFHMRQKEAPNFAYTHRTLPSSPSIPSLRDVWVWWRQCQWPTQATNAIHFLYINQRLYADPLVTSHNESQHRGTRRHTRIIYRA